MSFKRTRKLTFMQLADLLKCEMEKGTIGDDVEQFIQAGLLPIKLLRDKLQLVIERSDEEGYLNVTEI